MNRMDNFINYCNSMIVNEGLGTTLRNIFSRKKKKRHIKDVKMTDMKSVNQFPDTIQFIQQKKKEFL